MARNSSLLLLSALLIALLPGVAAAPFYEAWVYPGDTFTANNVLFAVQSGGSAAELLFLAGSDRYVLNYGECAYSASGQEKYCFTKSDYMDCVRGDYDCPDSNPDCCPYDVAHIRYEAGREAYGSYLELSNVVPTLSVQQTMEKSVLKLGESTKVTLTLENTGDDSVSGAVFRLAVPEGFTVVSATPDFQRAGSLLTLKASLASGAQKIYTYTVKPTDYVSGTFRANLTYTYKGAPKNATSSYTINVPSPFLITHTLAPPTVEVKDQSAYVYTLKNNDGQYEMDAEVRFSGLAGLVLVAPEDAELAGGTYVWSGTLEKGEAKTLSFTLRTAKTGLFPLTAAAAMEVNGETFESRSQDTLTVSMGKLVGILRAPDSAVTGENYTVRVLLNNTAGVGASAVEAVFSVNGTEVKSFSIERVLPSEAVLLAELSLAAPAVASDTQVTLILNGSYLSPGDERFPFTVSRTLSVKADTSPFVITQKVNATEAAPGDSLKVSVKVKNQGSTYATVAVTEVLPSSAFVSAGIRQQEMSIIAGKERDAYAYEVTVPQSYESPVFTITTQVFDKETGRRYTAATDVKVEQPDAPALNATNLTDPSAGGGEVAPPAENEKGFFRTLMDDVVGFFEALFA